MRNNQSLWLNILTYVGVYALAITAILWSYLEPGFYVDYIKGNFYLLWTMYIFPWVILIAVTLHLLDFIEVIDISRIFNKLFRR